MMLTKIKIRFYDSNREANKIGCDLEDSDVAAYYLMN